MSSVPDRENMLWKEEIANRPKHWVRLVTACNSKCLFLLGHGHPAECISTLKTSRQTFVVGVRS